MARLGIVFGLLLCGLTVTGLVVSPLKSPSQFIPMMFGIPMLFCGVVALNPHRRKQAMQVALALAALGALLAGSRAITTGLRWADGEPINSLAFTMVASMAIVCLVFFVAGTVMYARWRRQKYGESLGRRPGQPNTPGHPSR